MGERSRTSQEPGAVAVMDAPAPSATDAYTARVAELRAEEGRLSTLTTRQAAGERLTRDEVLDVLMLEQTVGVLRREVDDLTKPMLAEIEALDIADVVDISNNLIDPHVQAFNQLVQAIAALHAAKAEILRVHQVHADLTNSLPSFRNLKVAAPTGAETLTNLLNRLPDGQAWLTILMSPHSGPLTHAQVRSMGAVYVAAQQQTVNGLTRRVQMQRSQR